MLFVPGLDNPADIFTKNLGLVKVQKFCPLLGLKPATNMCDLLAQANAVLGEGVSRCGTGDADRLGVGCSGTPETGDVRGRSKIEGRGGRRLASAFKGCAPSELCCLDFKEVPEGQRRLRRRE